MWQEGEGMGRTGLAEAAGLGAEHRSRRWDSSAFTAVLMLLFKTCWAV